MADSLDADSTTVFQILRELDAVSFAHVIAEICAVRGWKPRVTVANSDYVGDVVASRSLPFRESVSLVRYVDGELSVDRLETLIERGGRDRTSKLAVIVHTPPSEETVNMARNRGVGIIGLTDVAESVVMLSLEDALEPHIEENDELRHQYEDLLDDRADDSAAAEPSGRSPAAHKTGSGIETDAMGSAAAEGLKHANLETLEQEVEYLFATARDEIQDLQARAVADPAQIRPQDDAAQNPILSIIRGSARRLNGLLLMSELMTEQTVDQISEANENAVERIEMLYTTYEANNLAPASGQTPEEALFEKTLQVLDRAEITTLDIMRAQLEEE